MANEVVNDFSIDAIKDNFTPPGAKSQKEEPIKPTDFGFPSIASFDTDINQSPGRYSNDYSDVVNTIMGYAETEGMTEEQLEKLKSEVEDMVIARADELKKDRQVDPNNDEEDLEVENLKEKYVNSKPARDVAENTPGEPYKRYPSFMKKEADDELDSFTKSLEDWLNKNPKARDKNYY